MTTTPAPRQFQRAWLGVPIVGALLVAAFLALPAGSVEQSAVYDALGLLMVGAAMLGIRLYGSSGWLPWLILALGQLAFVFGDIIWTSYAALGQDPFPSLADALYLLGYPTPRHGPCPWHPAARPRR